jgi:hypothetical protein
MNKRIKLLAQEAEMYVDLNGNPWPKWMSAEECELAYAKFAELIVRECLDTLYKNGCSCIPADRLKEHFGVEE